MNKISIAALLLLTTALSVSAPPAEAQYGSCWIDHCDDRVVMGAKRGLLDALTDKIALNQIQVMFRAPESATRFEMLVTFIFADRSAMMFKEIGEMSDSIFMAESKTLFQFDRLRKEKGKMLISLERTSTAGQLKRHLEYSSPLVSLPETEDDIVSIDDVGFAKGDMEAFFIQLLAKARPAALK